MIAMGVVGWKDSGKTTLATEIVRAFAAAGKRTAVIKHTHHGMDMPGTDTHRHLIAGAASVAGTGPESTAVIWPEEINTRRLAALMNTDILIVEGGKSLGWLPRIIVPRRDDSAEDIAALHRGLAVAAWQRTAAGAEDLPVLTDSSDLPALIMEKGFALAGLDCEACGREDCAGLARDIVAGKATARDCVAQETGVKVTVGGHAVPMKPFVEDMIRGGIVGMLKGLKDVGTGKVSIEFDMK